MPDEMMEKWLEYYDDNGLSWLAPQVRASIKQAFFAGGEAVEQMRAADSLKAEALRNCEALEDIASQLDESR